jgi:RES domain-containing protein
VSQKVWRIAVEAPAYTANDITGAGGLHSAGRWNSAGTAVLYCSVTISLAVLESLVIKRFEPLPYNRFLVRVDVPEEAWAAREVLPSPAGWDAIPAGLTSQNAGNTWVASMRSPILLVPSVVVPEEWNILINPTHPAATSITATTVRRWVYDPRLY